MQKCLSFSKLIMEWKSILNILTASEMEIAIDVK